ncbi:hypothetical protein [Chamaesiphon sp. GL140_3_metabinner_50]|uniref:hypothetical protein n=1 Tax=Chamaesiphon sp. GL140_3_metabinner_50 TaxID=2970812 RepID=UPI0025E137CB|nr:hypothetical protein [Chamaesiphon sp. GL140_3_metabinner_50]
MMPAKDPNNYDRQFRYFNRRLRQLEDTQASLPELERVFTDRKQLFEQRVYNEIDTLEDQIEGRFDCLEMRLDRLETRFNEFDRKLDIILSRSPERTSRSDD